MRKIFHLEIKSESSQKTQGWSEEAGLAKITNLKSGRQITNN